MGLDHTIIFKLLPLSDCDLRGLIQYMSSVITDTPVRIRKLPRGHQLTFEGDFMLIYNSECKSIRQLSAENPDVLFVYIDVVQHTASTEMYVSGACIHLCTDD